MSALLAVAQAVAATPMPTPEVIVKTVQLPQAIPANVLQLAQIAAVAGAGVATSVLHLVIERKKWSANVNRLLFTVYSALAGVVVMLLNGQFKFDTTGATTGLTTVLAFLGSTQGMKILTDFVSSLNTTTDAGAAVPLATDSVPPQAGV